MKLVKLNQYSDNQELYVNLDNAVAIHPINKDEEGGDQPEGSMLVFTPVMLKSGQSMTIAVSQTCQQILAKLSVAVVY